MAGKKWGKKLKFGLGQFPKVLMAKNSEKLLKNFEERAGSNCVLGRWVWLLCTGKTGKIRGLLGRV